MRVSDREFKAVNEKRWIAEGGPGSLESNKHFMSILHILRRAWRLQMGTACSKEAEVEHSGSFYLGVWYCVA